MENLSSDISKWTNKNVLIWLNGINMTMYKEQFVIHEVEGIDLIDLTEDNLKYDLKVVNLHHRKHILREILKILKSIDKKMTEQMNIKDENKKKVCLKEIIVKYKKTNQKFKFKISSNTTFGELELKIKKILNLPKEE